MMFLLWVFMWPIMLMARCTDMQRPVTRAEHVATYVVDLVTVLWQIGLFVALMAILARFL